MTKCLAAPFLMALGLLLQGILYVDRMLSRSFLLDDGEQ